MQIQGQQIQGQQQSQERPVQMRDGEVYRARVESRISDREAMISIRGQQVRATFEGGVPERDRVNIEVRGRTDEGVRVREITGDGRRDGARSQGDQQDVNRVLRNLGQRDPSPELRQAARQLMDRGVPLTRESVRDLSQYIQSNRGSAEQRQQTVQVMATKRLEPTANQLRAVHDALHGPRLTEQVRSMTNGRAGEAAQNRSGEAVLSRDQLTRAIDQIRTNVVQGRDVREQVQQVREQVDRVSNSEARRELTQALRAAERGEQPRTEQSARPERTDQARQPSQPQSREQLTRAIDQIRTNVVQGRDVREQVQQVREQVDRVSNSEARRELTQELRAAERGEQPRTEQSARPERTDQARQPSQPQSREQLTRAIDQIRTNVVQGRDVREQVQQVREQVDRVSNSDARRELTQALRAAERGEQPRTEQAARPERTDQARQPSQPQSREQLTRAIDQIRTNVQQGRDVREQVQQVREQVDRVSNSDARRELTQALRAAERGEQPRTEQTGRSERTEQVRTEQPRVSQSARQEVVRAAEQVRQALQTGQGLRQSIENLQQTVQNSGDREARQQVNQALREMITLQANSGREAAAGRIEQLTQTLQQAAATQTGSSGTAQQTTAQPTNMQALLTQISQTVQNSANLSDAIQQVRNQLSQQTIPQEVRERLASALNEAEARLSSGRELKARQTLTNTAQEIQQTLPQEPVTRSVSESQREMQEYMRNEVLQTMGTQPKAILITEVTERFAQATDDFKAFQRDASKQLNRIESMIQQFRNQATPQVRPMLDSLIKQLDRQLMKSDWMLFADMKTERRMLGASAQLHDAKKLLSQGKHAEARQLVRQVQTTMDQVQFKPSNQRVQHVLSQEQSWSEPKAPVHRLSEQFDQSSRMLTYNDGSARQVFEGMRGLGLNREAELAQIFAGGKDVPTEAQQRNLKTILMQLAKSEDEGSRMLQQQAQNSLSQLNGQQLMNRNEPQQNHMYFFQIPLMVKGESENLQVYVNSRNEGEQVDWENCNLYFHMETSSLGPLGIVLNVTDRNLSVTLKNDTDYFADSVEPLADRYLEQLKEVGYNVNKLSVKPMTVPEKALAGVQETDQEAKPETEAPLPFMTEEGFDYKI
ncbi:hypothetical protein [Salisediminibacterium selenitireducens]|uniref:Flagellar hook-length control protein-like C-terminal domain-containing protein n=1 Tax=Bacillus selenitireducens (strain ATCC 700615 / DSM 15326 / MLS10) TaxID=439292 RepID=D6XVK5_BACIE|nr:hypothetical protein [Salisediminibacterium selenitireducens]ADH99743.1 hypothetical protein Bsel_2239 [[Bacillus] selenitireducens MLS10]